MGKHGLRRLIIAGYLQHHASAYKLECATSSGFRNEWPLSILRSSLKNLEVHTTYVNTWPHLVGPASEAGSFRTLPTAHVSYSVFIPVWPAEFPTLRIGKNGRDFFIYRTSTKNYMYLHTMDGDTQLYKSLSQLIEQHRHDASTKYPNYKEWQSMTQKP